MGSSTNTRFYDSSRRRAQAQRTQSRVVEVARQHFLTAGYGATSISAIAAEAGASVESVYKSFGGKARLLKGVFDAEFAGPGVLSSNETAQRLSAEEHDPYTRLRAFGTLVAEIGPRVTPIALLVRDGAVSDPDLARVWEQLNQERLARMASHAERLDRDGHLRPAVSVTEARDVLWSLSSPELYDLLVRRQRWEVNRFGSWVGNAYIKALLP